MARGWRVCLANTPMLQKPCVPLPHWTRRLETLASGDSAEMARSVCLDGVAKLPYTASLPKGLAWSNQLPWLRRRQKVTLLIIVVTVPGKEAFCVSFCSDLLLCVSCYKMWIYCCYSNLSLALLLNFSLRSYPNLPYFMLPYDLVLSSGGFIKLP